MRLLGKIKERGLKVMADERTTSFKIVGLIVGVVVVAGSIVGMTFHVSTTLASNSTAIRALRENIAANKVIIDQHSRLLVVLERHSVEIKRLTDCETQGRRFTERDGNKLDRRVSILEEWAKDAPPQWFREVFREFREGVSTRLSTIEKILNQNASAIAVLKQVVPDHANGGADR